MPIKITICDDVQEDIAALSAALHEYDPSFEIVPFTSGRALIDETAESGFSADILFLDIYMPGIDGIQTARELRARYKDLKIIYLSSSKEHYPQAYEVFALNYILKPLDRERLYAVLERALDELRREDGHKIRVQYKGATRSFDGKDVLYVESRDKQLVFHLAGDGAVRCYGKLDELVRDLPERSFIRCHQSFLVNMAHISEMGDACFRIGKTMLNISRKHLKSAKEQYYAYLFSRMGGRRPQ
ncbi:MAG: LytTR family DNA-binding domain-containing protein [Bacillota bacterium]